MDGDTGRSHQADQAIGDFARRVALQLVGELDAGTYADGVSSRHSRVAFEREGFSVALTKSSNYLHMSVSQKSSGALVGSLGAYDHETEDFALLKQLYHRLDARAVIPFASRGPTDEQRQAAHVFNLSLE